MKVMVTGHRLERLANREKEVEEWLAAKLDELQPSIAISGMAAGVDQIYAELALKRNISALPYKKDWDSYHPVVQDMLMKAKEVIYAKKEYSKYAYYERDCMMVDAADIVLAVWDGKEIGGTWLTIDYARKQGKEIIYFPWNN